MFTKNLKEIILNVIWENKQVRMSKTIFKKRRVRETLSDLYTLQKQIIKNEILAKEETDEAMKENRKQKSIKSQKVGQRHEQRKRKDCSMKGIKISD